jgi:hypothetical protein
MKTFAFCHPSNNPIAHIFKIIAPEDGGSFFCEVLMNFLHTKDVTSSKTVD